MLTDADYSRVALEDHITALEGDITALKAHITTLESDVTQLREELRSLNVAFDLRETLSAFEAAVVAHAHTKNWLSQPTKLKQIGNITRLVDDATVRERLEVLVNILQLDRLPANTFAHARPLDLPDIVLDAWKKDVMLQLSDEECAWFDQVYSDVLPATVRIVIANKKSFEERKSR